MRFRFLNRWHEMRDARHEPEGRKALGRLYWAALSLSFLVFALACVGYGIWQFTRPMRAVESEAKVAAPRPPLQRAELQAVLEAFDARTERFRAEQAAPTALPDPS